VCLRYKFCLNKSLFVILRPPSRLGTGQLPQWSAFLALMGYEDAWRHGMMPLLDPSRIS
jgi:hypothetical protein